jgi:hypothetical protein
MLEYMLGVKTVQVGVDVVTKKSRRFNDAEREYLMQYQELRWPINLKVREDPPCVDRLWRYLL